MWTREYAKTYQGISKKAIWQTWVDVNHWPKWHGDLEYCRLDAPFQEGETFLLKPKGGPAVKIKLIKINKERSFTDCTSFLGAKMYDTHTLEETPNGLRLSNKIVVTGPLKWLWIKLVAKKVAASIPDEMDALVQLVKENA